MQITRNFLARHATCVNRLPDECREVYIWQDRIFICTYCRGNHQSVWNTVEVTRG